MMSASTVVLTSSLLCVLFGCSPREQGTETQKPKTDPEARSAKNYFRDCKKLKAEARHMDSTLLSQTELDNASANRAIKAFTDFAWYCQGDTLSPVYLIKCAQVAKAVNNIPQAKLVLDRCIGSYPGFKNRPAALFLLAQLYDEPTYLNDEHEAKQLYEKIINEYPASEWVESAKGALRFIGKSDDEIMKDLLRQKK